MVCSGRIHSGAASCLECLLHPAILAGMEGDDRDPSAGRQAAGKGGKQRIERGELVVHRDPQRLEGSARRHFHFGLGQRGI